MKPTLAEQLTKACARYRDATTALSWIGSKHPGDFAAIEREATNSSAALAVLIAKVEDLETALHEIEAVAHSHIGHIAMKALQP